MLPCGVQFERIHNFRDLGGIATVHREYLRPGRLYRSAGISAASEADLAVLTDELGIRTVVDLRTPQERMTFGSIAPVFERLVELPLLGQELVDRGMSWRRLSDSYHDYLRNRDVGERIVQVLTLLAAGDATPVIVCCSAGKDRTGLVIAAVLAALDVPDETIIHDYAASQAALAAMYADWAKHPSSTITELITTHWRLLDAPAEEMEILLKSVKRAYGALQGYLAAHGATSALLSGLRHTFLDRERAGDGCCPQ